MIDALRLLVCTVLMFGRTRAALAAENLVLRQQLLVLKRTGPTKPRITRLDRVIFVLLYRLSSSVRNAMTIVQPDTLVRWHRGGFKIYWKWRSRKLGGRPKIDAEIVKLIRKISKEDPLWGAPRIHGELLMLGIDVCETTVAEYMIAKPKRPGQTWKTFLRNHKECIAAMDFVIVPTINFKLFYCLVILHLRRRRIVWIGVTSHPTSEWVAQQLREAFPWDEAPKYLIRDRDGAFGHSVHRRMRAMGIRDRPTTPRSPWQNGYVERAIGSVRRECLDHMIIVGENHLRRTMKAYADYYNNARTHLSLGKDTPKRREIMREGMINSIPHMGGLHHQYVRI